MDYSYWYKQSTDAPLFPDVQWSRPENRTAAGKLLIVGGNAHGFSAPALAYQESVGAGIGTAKVLLPDALHKIVGSHMAEAEFAPSTPSGSFSRLALDNFIELCNWSDGVLIAGELGRNSETAILLESLLGKYSGQLTLTRDSVNYFYNIPQKLFDRPQLLLVLSIAQLQKLCINARSTAAITFSMDLLHLIEALHELTTAYPVNILVKHLNTIFVAHSGKVSTTKLSEEIPIWRVQYAAHAATWWLQHPTKTFEALTTSVLIA
jgi:ADP-dependent NAD(P)H-hydrate dehydratase / NAD(P)H-hydrate epimerase